MHDAIVTEIRELDAAKIASREALPKLVRVSLGTAIVLRLAEGKLAAKPSTAYLMTYTTGKCTANCLFCSQARGSDSKRDTLSRVTWPVYRTVNMLSELRGASERGKIKRVCIQALNYARVFEDLVALVAAIKEKCSLQVSVSCQPLRVENIRLLKTTGVDRLGLPLDAATKKVFNEVKGKSAGGPYAWQKQLDLLRDAVAIFGKDNVSTHLIVGLGETEKEMVSIIQNCADMAVLPGLFAFTPIQGTPLESRCQPPIESYRRLQVARFLIVQGARAENMNFNEKEEIVDLGVKREALQSIVKSGIPFLTSGCPSCNRPYYNEKPGGPIYNYPRRPTPKEIAQIMEDLNLSGA